MLMNSPLGKVTCTDLYASYPTKSIGVHHVKALALNSLGRLDLIESQPPQVGHDDVEINIVLTGICGTDLAVFTGRESGGAGIIRGHEAVGVVARVGAGVTRLKPGNRVVIDPNEYCASCPPCQAGRTNLCDGSSGTGLAISGVNQHGTFTEKYVTHKRFVYSLPETMNWETGVLIEPLACVLHNITQSGLVSGQRALILGTGPMSLVAQFAMCHLGIDVLSTELSPYRMSQARSLGFKVVHPDELDNLRNTGERFDAVIDTVGNQLETAVNLVRRGGVVVLFGFDDNYRYPLPAKQLLVDAISIIGAGEYNQEFSRAVKVAADIPQLGSLITTSYALDDHEQAIATLLDPAGATTMKAVFAVSTV